MHGEKVQLEGTVLRIRRIRADMIMLKETVKSCCKHHTCRCLERQHTVVDLYMGKETSHCGLTSGHMMRHRESEGMDVMLPARALNIARGNQDSCSDMVHKRSLQ